MEEAALLVNALGQASEEIVHFAWVARSRPEIRDVKRLVDLRRADDKVFVELYVDAELHTGVSVCWAIEIEIGSTCWRLEAKVVKTTVEGQTRLEEFPAKSGSSVEHFARELSWTTRALTRTIDWVRSGAKSPQ